MALTLGTEYALFMRSDERISYTAIEAALVDAGLEEVTINRNFNGEGYDIHIIVRHTDQGQPLAAAETVRALAEAVEAIDEDDDVPAPPPAEPPAEPEPPTE